jgi:hypothetical protein
MLLLCFQCQFVGERALFILDFATVHEGSGSVSLRLEHISFVFSNMEISSCSEGHKEISHSSDIY